MITGLMEFHEIERRLTALPSYRMTASRSGGPGGQNVNKVSSRVEVRFRIEELDWIHPAARQRLRELFPSRVTEEGEFRMVSSLTRDQKRNLQDCLEKIADCLRTASKRPRPRVATAPTRSSRRRRLDEKRHQGEKKRGRRGGFEGE